PGGGSWACREPGRSDSSFKSPASPPILSEPSPACIVIPDPGRPARPAAVAIPPGPDRSDSGDVGRRGNRQGPMGGTELPRPGARGDSWISPPSPGPAGGGTAVPPPAAGPMTLEYE